MTQPVGPRCGPDWPGGPADASMTPVTTLPTVTEAPVAAVTTRSAGDVFMRRLLRVDESQPRMGEDELRRGFSTSLLVSATRCVLTYLVIPFLAPILGVAAGVAPIIGIPIGILAIVFNIKSMRRFWRADHRWRWGYTAISATVIAMLVVLIALDVAEILS